MPPLEPQAESRRTFFARMIGLSTALIGLGLAIPFAGYVIGPALKRRASSWNDLGTIEGLRPGEPEELEFVNAVKDGWRTTTVKKVVWAVKQPEGSVVVYSPIYPHLGCGYRWDGEDKRFKCPCHGSVYDVTGNVLAGPAPRPLDVLPSKLEQGKLLVMYKQFKSGLAHPVEL